VLATLSSFFGWLRRNRRIERNPCGNVHRPDAAPARDRTLTDNEIVAFWHACDDLGEPIGPRLKLPPPLGTIDFPPGYQTVMRLAEFAPGTCSGRHTHPGIATDVPLP
jgi:hypothetical protein